MESYEGAYNLDIGRPLLNDFPELVNLSELALFNKEFSPLPAILITETQVCKEGKNVHTFFIT